MLPITLPRQQVEELMNDADAGYDVDIDLTKQLITRKNGMTISFEIDSFRKHCLINGLDDIGLTLERVEKIAAFESTRSLSYPWLDNASQKYVKTSV